MPKLLAPVGATIALLIMVILACSVDGKPDHLENPEPWTPAAAHIVEDPAVDRTRPYIQVAPKEEAAPAGAQPFGSADGPEPVNESLFADDDARRALEQVQIGSDESFSQAVTILKDLPGPALAEVWFQWAQRYMYDESLSRGDRAGEALWRLREALAVDPGHEAAASLAATVERIYRQMGKDPDEVVRQRRPSDA